LIDTLSPVGPFVDLDSAVAVITGAGSGIGRATAQSLARRGSRIVVTDVDEPRAVAVAEEVAAGGGEATALRCDVTQLSDIEAVRDAALDRFGRVDVVMNNVGVMALGPVELIPLEEWQRVIDVNLLGIVRSNLVFLPLLLHQGRGHVVNTASLAGLLPYGHDRLPYTTTKHAVVGLSESLALYLRPKGIGVTCLCPAGVVTNIVEQIRVFGPPTPPRSPNLPVVDPEVVGELVADTIAEGRFLALTTPEVGDELLAHARDLDAYLEAQVRDSDGSAG
jgi:NAD(P)-dependent dehydrogenase (short-subunit alcohol dehydrogenase family)